MCTSENSGIDIAYADIRELQYWYVCVHQYWHCVVHISELWYRHVYMCSYIRELISIVCAPENSGIGMYV